MKLHLILLIFCNLFINSIGFCQNGNNSKLSFDDILEKYHDAILENQNEIAKTYLTEAANYVTDNNRDVYNAELAKFNYIEQKRIKKLKLEEESNKQEIQNSLKSPTADKNVSSSKIKEIENTNKDEVIKKNDNETLQPTIEDKQIAKSSPIKELSKKEIEKKTKEEIKIANAKAKEAAKAKANAIKSYAMVSPSIEVQKRLLDAIKKNDTVNVKQFLANGASINYFGTYNTYEPSTISYAYMNCYTEPLLAAIHSNARETVKLLLRIEPLIINSQCLHAAIDRNDTTMLKFLIENGADVNLNGNEQYMYFNDKITQLYKPVNWWNDHDAYGGTPVDFAMSKEKYAIVAILKRYGAKVSTGQLNALLLNAASWGNQGDYEKCKLLVSMGANVNVTSEYNPYKGIYANYTPLLYAAKWNNTKLQILLINNGADVNWSNSFQTALFFAVQRPNNKEVVELLLKNGANVNFVGREGILSSTPTLSVLKVSLEEYKDMLIFKGAR